MVVPYASQHVTIPTTVYGCTVVFARAAYCPPAAGAAPPGGGSLVAAGVARPALARLAPLLPRPLRPLA